MLLKKKSFQREVIGPKCLERGCQGVKKRELTTTTKATARLTTRETLCLGS